jgi:hypothetical protein
LEKNDNLAGCIALEHNLYIDSVSNKTHGDVSSQYSQLIQLKKKHAVRRLLEILRDEEKKTLLWPLTPFCSRQKSLSSDIESCL